jgi:hypothetical protein
VYIRCGRLTCCDYLYFYVRKAKTGKAELICTVCDAKHTNQDDGGGDSITTPDQTGLFKAVCRVASAVRAAKLVLGNVRILFVSNRTRFTVSDNLSANQQAAAQLFPDVTQELLNTDTFEFGPFSDILGARRQPVGLKKRGKTEEDEEEPTDYSE